jgi:RNA polymerase sigma factor (sigma-70 family)
MAEPDATLLRAFAEERSEAAFAELVRRYVDLVYAAARRQLNGDSHQTEEATQAVFAVLARRAGSLVRHQTIVGWLHTTTRWVVLRMRRTERRRREREREAYLMQEILSDSSPAEEWERLPPIVDETLSQLQERDREAVLLRYFGGLSFAEVGARLELSENAARMRVDRALEKLRLRLARRGIGSSSAALGLVLANEAASAVPSGLAASVAASAMMNAAVGSASLFAATLAFMNTSKMVGGIAVVAVLGLGGSAYEWRRAAENAATADDLRRERQTLRVRAAVLAEKLEALTRERTAAAGSTPLSASVSVAAETKDVNSGSPSARASTPFAKPDYARLEVEKFRAALALRYAPLYRRLGLSPEQIAAFEAALVEMQQGVVDIWSAAGDQGVVPGDLPVNTAVARMTSDPITASQAKVEKLLGPAGYKAFQDFNVVETARGFVSSLAGAVYDTEAPLTSSQGDALTVLLQANTKKVKTRMADDGADHPLYSISDATDWDVVKERAAAVLAPGQLKAFYAILEQKRIEEEQERIENPPDLPAVTAGK